MAPKKTVQKNAESLQQEIDALKQKNAQLEASLKNKKNELQNIISNIPFNIFWMDHNGRIIGCNDAQAKCFGLERSDQLLNMNIFDVGRLKGWNKNIAETIRCNDLEIMHSMAFQETEEKVLLNGEPRTFLSKKCPLLDYDKQKATGVIGIAIDITQRKQLENELLFAKEAAEMASDSKTEFLRNMSHDIKTPLAGIMGLSEILSRRLKDENHALSNDIGNSAKILMKFFNNCLEISNQELTDITTIKGAFDIKEQLSTLTILFSPAINKNNILFAVHYEKKLPTNISGYYEAIHRILLNLIGNAIKFTTHGSIIITVDIEQLEQSQLIVTIKDTGIGIDPTNLGRIFEKFVRLEPSCNGNYSGTGLGLHVVKLYIDKLGGTINVSSELGRGTTFSIKIPIEIMPN